MTRWLGEKSADLLLAFLMGLIPIMIIRDIERERRLATIEAKIVGEPRVVAIEQQLISSNNRLEIAITEIMRLREGVTDMLLPIISEFISRGMNNESPSSNPDDEPLPDGEDE